MNEEDWGSGTTVLAQISGGIREFRTHTLWLGAVCIMCEDPECDGACAAAMIVVRQVIEALDNEDSANWWKEYFGLIDGDWRGVK